MSARQQDEFPPEEELPEGETNTPIDTASRTTGSGTKTDAKSTAKQESGDSDPLVEGGGNQGTEKR